VGLVILACLLGAWSGSTRGQTEGQNQSPTGAGPAEVKMFPLNDASSNQLLEQLRRVFGEESVAGAGDQSTDAVVVRGSADVLRALEVIMGQRQQARPANGDRAEQVPATPPAVPSPPAIADDPALLPLRSEVRRPTSIRWLAPEGTQAAQGDLVALLDDSELIAEAEERRLEIAELETQAAFSPDDVAERQRIQQQASQMALQIAELRLEQFTDPAGEAAYEVGEVEGQIAVTEQALQLAEERVERLSQRAASGQASEDDLAEARLAAVEARTQQLQAQARKRLLSQHMHPLRLAELKLAVAEAEWVRALAEMEAAQQIARAKAQATARRTQLEIAADRLQRIEQQIAGCRILAPVDGTVQHALPLRTGDPRPRVGTTVWPDQPVLLLRRAMPARQ
jgi:hypothetical protein